MASPGSGKTFVISEKIKRLLADDGMRDYQGVIAISYTRKASGHLKQKSLSDGVWCKNSFFGTIDSFCLTQIVLPFGSYVMGYPEKDVTPIAIGDLPKERKDDFLWLTQGHPPYSEIKAPTWKLLYELYGQGHVLIEALELLALHLMKECVACRKYVKARFKYVFIDEYQDADEYTDGILHELLGLGLTGNVVGDANQSIFGFAHKSSQYLKALENHPEFTPFRLAQNFRCSTPIINYSNRLIDKYSTLLETDEEGVQLITVNGSEEQVAEYLARYIKEDCGSNGVEKMSEVAVLVRNKRTQTLIDNSLDIPHKVIESTELDADLNPRSRLYGLLLQYYLDPVMRMMTIIDEFVDMELLPQKQVARLERLKDEIRGVEMKDSADKLSSLFKEVGDILLPDIQEGIASEHLALVLGDKARLDTYRPITGNEVLIMTLHKAKGLEFELVYHLNMNAWELPFKKVENGDWDHPLYPCWEQDLDLHYVGVTRARKVCYLITSTQRHNNDDKIKKSEPSEFLRLNGVEGLRKDYTYGFE